MTVRGNDCKVTTHRAVRRESNLITNHFKSKPKDQQFMRKEKMQEGFMLQQSHHPTSMSTSGKPTQHTMSKKENKENETKVTERNRIIRKDRPHCKPA